MALCVCVHVRTCVRALYMYNGTTIQNKLWMSHGRFSQGLMWSASIKKERVACVDDIKLKLNHLV